MRFRITQTVVVEYEVDAENYLGETDPPKMLEVDLGWMRDDPSEVATWADAEITTTGEIIEEVN